MHQSILGPCSRNSCLESKVDVVAGGIVSAALPTIGRIRVRLIARMWSYGETGPPSLRVRLIGTDA